MTDVAFSDLTELTSLAADDLFCVTDDSESSSEKSKKVEWETIRDDLIITGQFLRPQFSWKDADELYIGAGFYDVAGKYAGWTSKLTKSIGSLSASTKYYVYLDESGITSGTAITASEIAISSTAPSYSQTYRGWYNSADRCIFGFRTDGSSQLPEFYHSGEIVHFADHASLYSNSPTSQTWTDVTCISPAFSTKAIVVITGANANPRTLNWRTNGQTGTTGHRVLETASGSTYDSASVIVDTDSSQKFEIYASGADTVTDVWQSGWFFPVGM